MKHVKRNEIEAMNIIINIQTMQDAIYEEHFQHNQFNGNSIDELRALQDSLIKEYNKMIKERKSLA